MPWPTTDLALRFDATRLACDLTIADGDLVLDATPATPMVVTLLSDRRAAADDRLPAGISALGAPATWDARRGWVGDALDRFGHRIGCRLWLLARDHDDETTRRMAEIYTAEGFAWAKRDFDVEPEIEVAWVRRGLLGIRIFLDGRSISLQRSVQ